MEQNSTKPTETFSENLINELNVEQLTKKMKNLALAVLILDILLILALFLSFNAFLYSLFILAEMVAVGLIGLLAIRLNRVNKYTYRAQRMTVLVCTMIQSVVILSMCIFEIATNNRAPTVIGIVFQMILPGIVVILLKLWFIFIKRQLERKMAERQMNIQDDSQFYTYNQIGQTNSKL